MSDHSHRRCARCHACSSPPSSPRFVLSRAHRAPQGRRGGHAPDHRRADRRDRDRRARHRRPAQRRSATATARSPSACARPSATPPISPPRSRPAQVVMERIGQIVERVPAGRGDAVPAPAAAAKEPGRSAHRAAVRGRRRRRSRSGPRSGSEAGGVMRGLRSSMRSIIAAVALLGLKVLGSLRQRHAERSSAAAGAPLRVDAPPIRARPRLRQDQLPAPTSNVTGAVPASRRPPRPSAAGRRAERARRAPPPSASERALLERLGERREEWQQKGRETSRCASACSRTPSASSKPASTSSRPSRRRPRRPRGKRGDTEAGAHQEPRHHVRDHEAEGRGARVRPAVRTTCWFRSCCR